jgi:Terminase large subunit, T4likevirus-type, N-terminal
MEINSAISLNRDFARALDPVLLARDCGIDPDPVQAKLLSNTANRVLLMCTRQWGKSTVAGLIATHELIYGETLHGRTPLVVAISPSQTQSTELFKKIRGNWARLPGAPAADQESLTRLQLSNGARIVSLPGSETTTRGFSAATLVLMDEAARVDDELLAAVRPMLATTGGRFVALTTPKGKRGWFYESWMHGEGWERVSVKASECPRISEDFLAQEREALGPLLYSQEYECAFIDPENSVFDTDLIQGALTDDFQLFLS